MNQLSEKELSMLNASLNEEQMLVKKFQDMASRVDDSEVSQKFTEISKKHQSHFDKLYSLLG